MPNIVTWLEDSTNTARTDPTSASMLPNWSGVMSRWELYEAESEVLTTPNSEPRTPRIALTSRIGNTSGRVPRTTNARTKKRTASPSDARLQSDPRMAAKD